MVEVTRDAFLGGRLVLAQPATGYRAGGDPVLLAAAVPARAGEVALELGCGVGTAMLCLARRTGARVVGLEREALYAQLAEENARTNALAAEVFTGDLSAPPTALRALTVDHVLMNPPYFPPGGRTQSADAGREAGRGEVTPLSDWIDAGTRRLKPGGTLSVIQRAERLGDLLAAFDARLGSTVIRPLSPRAGREARLVIVQARKGGRAALRLAAPLILHDGTRHEADGEDYAPWAQAVLRNGEALPD